MLMARPGAADTSTREAALGVIRALCTQRGAIHKPNVVRAFFVRVASAKSSGSFRVQGDIVTLRVDWDHARVREQLCRNLWSTLRRHAWHLYISS